MGGTFSPLGLSLIAFGYLAPGVCTTWFLSIWLSMVFGSIALFSFPSLVSCLVRFVCFGPPCVFIGSFMWRLSVHTLLTFWVLWWLKGPPSSPVSWEFWPSTCFTRLSGCLTTFALAVLSPEVPDIAFVAPRALVVLFKYM